MLVVVQTQWFMSSHATLPLNLWLRMCSKMAAKLTNSSHESSMGSAVYFSRRVFTENLQTNARERQSVRQKSQWI